MKEAHDHHRVTPEGRLLGEQMAKMFDIAERRLGTMADQDERCASCAFRPGTVPNGCAQTQLDVSKCVAEGIPFYCHQPGGHMCHGWSTVSIGLADVLPSLAHLTKDTKLSPPDSQFHIVEAAEAKRERRAAKRRQLAAKGAVNEVLPAGLWRASDGTLMYECVSCGENDEWPAHIADFDINNRANQCGRSPRCCP